MISLMMAFENSQPLKQVLLAVFVGLVAFLVLRYSTESGIIVSPDSATYLSVAKSVKTELTLTDHTQERLSHFPPGYSLTIAAFSKMTGFDVRFGGPRMLNTLCFSVFVFSVCLFFTSTTGSSFFGSLTAILLLTNSHMVTQFSMALSEGPFIVAASIGVFSLANYLSSGRELALRVAAISVGCAFLIRFVGIVWIGCFALLVIVDRRRLVKGRFQRLLEFLLVSCSPMAAWLVSCWLLALSGTNRRFRWHPVSGEDLFQLYRNVTAYFFLEDGLLWEISGFALLVICVIGAARVLFVYIFASQQDAMGSPKLAMAAAFVLVAVLVMTVYSLFLIFSRSLLDRATPFDSRLVGPIAWMLVPAGCMALSFWWETDSRLPLPPRDICIALCTLVSLSGSIDDFVYRMERCHFGQMGLNAGLETDRLVHRWLRDHPETVVVYSNKPWMPYLATNVMSLRYLPQRGDYTSGATNERYDSDAAELRDLLQAGKAVIVYWTDEPHEPSYQCMSLPEVLELASGLETHTYVRYSTVGFPLLTE